MLAALGLAGPGGLTAGAYAGVFGGAPGAAAIARRDPKTARFRAVGRRILAASADLCAGPAFHGEAPVGAAAAPEAPEAPACDYPLILLDGSGMNAFTDGRRIKVTRGLLRFAVRDAELAFAIAHEVAHNLIHAGRGALAGSRKQMEYDADRLGLFLVARAGYAPERAAGLLRRLSASRSGNERLNADYPTFSARYEALPDAVREIERRRAAGEALIPEFVRPMLAQTLPD